MKTLQDIFYYFLPYTILLLTALAASANPQPASAASCPATLSSASRHRHYAHKSASAIKPRVLTLCQIIVCSYIAKGVFTGYLCLIYFPIMHVMEISKKKNKTKKQEKNVETAVVVRTGLASCSYF